MGLIDWAVHGQCGLKGRRDVINFNLSDNSGGLNHHDAGPPMFKNVSGPADNQFVVNKKLV
jgi:hypothetical protein